MQDAVIVSAVRSAFTSVKTGGFAYTRPDDLLAKVIREALAKVPQMDWRNLDDVFVGCATTEGEQGLNIARNAGIMAGIPASIPATTINRFGASSVAALIFAAQAIESGRANMIVCGGVESLSRVQLGGFNPSLPPKLLEDFPEALTPSGVAAENLGRKFGVSRAEQDQYAFRAHEKALKHIKEKNFAGEVVPLHTVDQQGQTVIIVRDELPRALTEEELTASNPMFIHGGTITNENIAAPADGASALVVMSRGRAESLNIPPIAKIKDWCSVGCPAEIMSYSAILSASKVLKSSDLKISDMDQIEMMDLYAASALANLKELKLDSKDSRYNQSGGTLALGNPVGASSGRLIATLTKAIETKEIRYGLLILGSFGGQGVGMILEKA